MPVRKNLGLDPRQETGLRPVPTPGSRLRADRSPRPTAHGDGFAATVHSSSAPMRRDFKKSPAFPRGSDRRDVDASVPQGHLAAGGAEERADDLGVLLLRPGAEVSLQGVDGFRRAVEL